MIRPQIYTFSLVTTQTTTRGLCALARNADSKTKKFLLATVDWYIEQLPARLPKLPEPSCNMARLPLPRIIAKENNDIRYFTYTVLWRNLKLVMRWCSILLVVVVITFLLISDTFSTMPNDSTSDLHLLTGDNTNDYTRALRVGEECGFQDEKVSSCYSRLIHRTTASKIAKVARTKL